MMNARNFMFLGALVLAFSACKKDEAPVPDLGYSYFPTAVGKWVEYQVDSMWRDDATGVWDSVSYRLLERIEENYTDLEGRPSQRIERSVKDANDLWLIRDVWTSTRNSTAAEKTEENMRRLKLSFPVRDTRTWDINVYNTEPELKVAFREEGSAWSANGLQFPRTVLVKNTVPINAVFDRTFQERYADGVGMVSKLWVELETQTRFIPPPVNVFVTERRGWRLTMTAVAYGTD